MARRGALVTGATRGTALVIARCLADGGARVVIADSEAPTLPLGGEILFVRADVTSREGITAMLAAAEEAFGGLDVLVNNAGGAEDPPFSEASADELDRCLDLNLRAPLHAIHRALPVLRGRGGGAIVNIASVGGWPAVRRSSRPTTRPGRG
jgi:NAD(P)-dependent dehydrogenase (short-subunit alcohol dehydrogenase family)